MVFSLFIERTKTIVDEKAYKKKNTVSSVNHTGLKRYLEDASPDFVFTLTLVIMGTV